jgi:hypothetical protein
VWSPPNKNTSLRPFNEYELQNFTTRTGLRATQACYSRPEEEKELHTSQCFFKENKITEKY